MVAGSSGAGRALRVPEMPAGEGLAAAGTLAAAAPSSSQTLPSSDTRAQEQESHRGGIAAVGGKTMSAEDMGWVWGLFLLQPL